MSDVLDISISKQFSGRGRRLGRHDLPSPKGRPKVWTDQKLARLAEMVAADETFDDIASFFGASEKAIRTAVSRNIKPGGWWQTCRCCGEAYMTDSKFIRLCEPCKS